MRTTGRIAAEESLYSGGNETNQSHMTVRINTNNEKQQ